MAGWRDEVKQHMDAVILEAGIALDSGFFCQNIVVFAFQVIDYFGEAESPY
jgi:hypothetical protein